MENGKEPKLTFGQPEHIDTSDKIELDLEDLRSRRIKGLNEPHLWVIGTIFRLDDPEQAQDKMVLGGHNMVGFTAIYCLWCLKHYHIDLKDAVCN